MKWTSDLHQDNEAITSEHGPYQDRDGKLYFKLSYFKLLQKLDQHPVTHSCRQSNSTWFYRDLCLLTVFKVFPDMTYLVKVRLENTLLFNIKVVISDLGHTLVTDWWEGRWELSTIPKLMQSAILKKGVVSSLLDQTGNQIDGNSFYFIQFAILVFVQNCIINNNILG